MTVERRESGIGNVTVVLCCIIVGQPMKVRQHGSIRG